MSSGLIGTIGTTSAAPIRGCAPSCPARSIRSRAHAIPASRVSINSSSSPTSVNTERWWSASTCTSSKRAGAESVWRSASITAASRPSEKFGTASSTIRRLGGVKAYYEARAPEYDDWWLGTGLYAERDRPGWEEEREALIEALTRLEPARTGDVACGTGVLTQYLPGGVTGLDQSPSMLELAAERRPDARLL